MQLNLAARLQTDAHQVDHLGNPRVNPVSRVQAKAEEVRTKQPVAEAIPEAKCA